MHNRMQNSSEEYGLMMISQEKNFSYGVNAHKLLLLQLLLPTFKHISLM